MRDIISIHALTAKTLIGVHPWEQAIPQTVCLDIDMGTDIQLAAEKDDITATLDYDAISHQLVEFLSAHSCQLIETLAEKIANFLLSHYPIPWVKLTVVKPGAIADAKSVAVTIERHANAAKEI